MQFKKGAGWKACHDAERNYFSAEYGGIQAYHLYEITREQFDALNTRMTEWDASKIISEGRHLYMSVDDRCGPPYTVIFDDDYKTLCPWADVIKSGTEMPAALVNAAVELFASEENNRGRKRGENHQDESIGQQERNAADGSRPS